MKKREAEKARQKELERKRKEEEERLRREEQERKEKEEADRVKKLAAEKARQKERKHKQKEEEERLGKKADVSSCMKIVVENYHNQWNLFCEQEDLPSSCALSDEYAKQINTDYEIGKAQCDNFFKK